MNTLALAATARATTISVHSSNFGTSPMARWRREITGLLVMLATFLATGIAVAQDRMWKECELGSRDPDRAIAACSKLLTRRGHAEAFHNRGLAFAAKENLDQALSDISRGIRLDPQRPYRWQERGEIYIRQGKYQQAIADISEAIRLDSTPRAFRFHSRAEAYRSAGDLTRAVADFDEAIRLDPVPRSFRFSARGNTLRDARQYDRALADYDTALKLEPANAWVLLDRGRTYARMGRSEAAKSDFSAALALDPSNEQLRQHIEGEFALLLGQSPTSTVPPSHETPSQPASPQQPASVQHADDIRPKKPTALDGPFAEPPKQYSIVEVAHESRACRPAFSDNCITLKKGERVVVLAWQIDDKPRRGLYCLRPLNMGQCYYADITAIEVNGVPVPTVGMDKPPEEKPITAEDCKPLPGGIEGLKTTTMGQLSRHTECIKMDGGAQLFELYEKWVYVSVCNQAREGYLLQYVNDVELDRARRGVQGAERELLKRHSSLAERKDQIWQEASRRKSVSVYPELCKARAAELWNANPDGAIIVPKP
jgi:tetratricopeptide (TPR) repeat protein